MAFENIVGKGENASNQQFYQSCKLRLLKNIVEQDVFVKHECPETAIF